MPIEANVTKSPITASVSETKVDVAVGQTSIDVSVAGGVGPTGPAGPTAMASASVLGAVRIGSGVSIDGNGIISVSTAYAAVSHSHGFLTSSGTITDNAVSPAFVTAPAVVTTSGFLRQGEFGTTSGTIAEGNHTHDASVLTGGTVASARLPIASANAVGGVRIGSGISIDGSGVISASSGYTLPTATNSVLGGVKIGSGLSIDGSGVLSATYSYSLPIATASVLGGVKQGSNVTIAADGTISVAAPVTSLPYSSITGTPTLATVATSGSAADLSGTLSASRLPATTVTAGSYGSASSVATYTVDSAGRLTAAGSISIAISAGAVSGLASVATAGTFASLTSKPTTLSGYGITDGVTTSDSRLSDARTPTSHTHGNITNAGAIGSTSGQIVVTTTGGALTTAASISTSQVSGLGTLATQSGTFSGTSSGTNTGDQTITLTGDVTGSGTGSFAATLANTAVVAGSYGSASKVATYTVDAKGRLTAAGETSIAISSGAVSGLGGAATLNVGTTSGTVAAGDHTHSQLHDRSHAITSTSDHTAGNWKVIYTNGSGQVVELALGTSGQVLTANGTSAAPTFGNVAYANIADPTVTSPSQITAAQNDYASFARGINRFTTNGAYNLTGMVAGNDGEVRVLCNVGTTAANTLTIKDQSSSSTAANRFAVPWTGDCVIPAGGSVVVFYDNTTARWRVI